MGKWTSDYNLRNHLEGSTVVAIDANNILLNNSKNTSAAQIMRWIQSYRDISHILVFLGMNGKRSLNFKKQFNQEGERKSFRYEINETEMSKKIIRGKEVNTANVDISLACTVSSTIACCNCSADTRGRAESLLFISGDGDFKPVIKQARKDGVKNVVVAAQEDSISKGLAKSADTVIVMKKDFEKHLLNYGKPYNHKQETNGDRNKYYCRRK